MPTCLPTGASAVAGLAEASAFLHRRVYPDLARDHSIPWLAVNRCVRGGRACRGCLLSGFSSVRGCRRPRLHSTHMLAGCHIVRYPEAAHAEESQQAAAPLCGWGGCRRQRTLLLEFIARRDATSLFVSIHDHCPNAYIASPFTTVV